MFIPGSLLNGQQQATKFGQKFGGECVFSLLVYSGIWHLAPPSVLDLSNQCSVSQSKPKRFVCETFGAGFLDVSG